MKPNKNNIQIISLLAAALSLVVALFSILFDSTRFETDDLFLMEIFVVLAVCITSVYMMLILKRVNPKQYIYLSFSQADKEIAYQILTKLDEELNKFTRYRFEILTSDSIPYGANIEQTLQAYFEKSNKFIVLVSEQYLTSKLCINEFAQFSQMEKQLIPIVTTSYDCLSKLPKDMSNIKALYLNLSNTTTEFDQHIKTLAIDIVRQYREH